MIWSDQHLLELRFDDCDGRSLFSCDTYVARAWPQQVVDELSAFRAHLGDHPYELRAGTFGPDRANGAASCTLQFRPPGALLVSVHLQRAFEEFGGARVASEATLYLHTQPVLLDGFIEELRALGRGTRRDAGLECLEQ